MFWKFQSQQSDTTESVASQQVAPAPPNPEPKAEAPQPAPEINLAPPFGNPPEKVPEVETPASYQYAAERTMRFLAETLAIPTWVLFKNQAGILSVITGIGEYERYLAGHDLSVGRLSDLRTVNILAAHPAPTTPDGSNRRAGGIDPGTVAPYGIPTADSDGYLFALLCAFGEGVSQQRLAQAKPVIEYAAGMMRSIVRTELTLEEAARRTERAQADALVDPLTGLHNRRSWDQLLATEDQRCSRFGYDAVIFMIDVDELKAVNDRFGHEKGDELIKNAATSLERSVRRTDVVARVGGDEFAILAVKCDASAAARIRDHIESTLMRANAPATVGYSVRSEAGDLFEAWRQADGAMYNRKRGKSNRGTRATDQPTASAPVEAPPAPESAAPPAQEPAPPQHAPAPQQHEPAHSAIEGSASVIAQILERVIPTLTGTQKPAPPVQPQAAPTPPPPPLPEPAPASPPQPEPEPAPPPQPEPQAHEPGPSDDLVDIVSRLSRLSDNERRLLDVFFKGSR
jgi:diguanylate cyclase (GGDEF)-like protein